MRFQLLDYQYGHLILFATTHSIKKRIKVKNMNVKLRCFCRTSCTANYMTKPQHEPIIHWVHWRAVALIVVFNSVAAILIDGTASDVFVSAII